MRETAQWELRETTHVRGVAYVHGIGNTWHAGAVHVWLLGWGEGGVAWVLISNLSLGDGENAFWEEVGLGHYESRKTSDSIKSDIGNEQMHTF